MKQLELMVLAFLVVLSMFEIYNFLINNQVIYTKKAIKSAKVKSIILALMISSIVVIMLHLTIRGSDNVEMIMFIRTIGFYIINHIISWVLIYYSEKGIIKF